MRKLALTLIILLVAVISGCTRGSYSVLYSKDLSNAYRFAMSYSNFNGWRSKSIRIGDTGATLELAIETGDGSITVTVTNDSTDAEIYRGEFADTQTVTVALDASTQYTLRVDANDHSGSFSFYWGGSE